MFVPIDSSIEIPESCAEVPAVRRPTRAWGCSTHLMLDAMIDEFGVALYFGIGFLGIELLLFVSHCLSDVSQVANDSCTSSGLRMTMMIWDYVVPHGGP